MLNVGRKVYVILWVVTLLAMSKQSLASSQSNTVPIRFSPAQQKLIQKALKILESQKEFTNFDLSTLLPHSIATDKLKINHVKFNQMHPDGIPVFKVRLGVHMKNGKLLTISGRLEKNLEDMSTHPTLLEREATEIAEDAVKGEIEQEPQFKSIQLTILSSRWTSDQKGHLAWHVIFEETSYRWNVFVDAKNGKMLLKFNEVCTGTGTGDYTGEVSIETDDLDQGYEMRDLTRKITTYNDDIDSSSMQEQVFWDEDDLWGNPEHEEQRAGVDAHYHAEWTYDYYLNMFGRKSFDGEGQTIQMIVHYEENYNNAFWNGMYLFFGDGDGVNFSSLTPLDIVAHEFTHGVTQYTAGLIYSGESGGLNEAFSDILGTAVEFYAANSGYGKADWNEGEDAYTPDIEGDAIRYLDDPPRDGKSIDHYSKYYAGLDVHYSSGIANNAFYLLSEGGIHKTSGIEVKGIGIKDAEQIFYRALEYYLSPDSNFLDACFATLQSAVDLYGEYSIQAQSLMKAWQAVGVFPILELESEAFYGSETVVMKPYATADIKVHFEWPFYMPGNIRWFLRRNPNPFTEYSFSEGAYIEADFDPNISTVQAPGDIIETFLHLESGADCDSSLAMEIVCLVEIPNFAHFTLSKAISVRIDDDIPWGTSFEPDWAIRGSGSTIKIEGINLENTTSVKFLGNLEASFDIEYQEGDEPCLLVQVPAEATNGPVWLNGVPVADGQKEINIYDTLQQVIDAVQDGDEIIVPPGVYRENLFIADKSIRLVSQSGPEETILESPGDTDLIQVYKSSHPNMQVSIIGFTLRNEIAKSYCIDGYSGKYEQLIIQDNVFKAGLSGSITVHGITSTAKNIIIQGNHFYGGPYSGVFCSIYPVSSAQICNNLIQAQAYSQTMIYVGKPSDQALTELNILNNTLQNLYPEGSSYANTAIKTAALQSGEESTTAYVTNNIIDRFKTGISITEGALSFLFQSNCVFGSQYSYVGIEDQTGTNGNISLDPLLEEDGHLDETSPMIDTGTDLKDLGMTDDFESDLRPCGSQYDIGADEYCL